MKLRSAIVKFIAGILLCLALPIVAKNPLPSLEENKSLERGIAGTDIHSYQLILAAGESARVELRSNQARLNLSRQLQESQAALEQPAPVEELRLNQPVERTVNDAFSHSYHFSLPSGGFADVKLQAQGLNLLFTLSTAQGTRLFQEGLNAQKDTQNDNQNIAVALAEATELRLTVEPIGRTPQRGKYVVTVIEQRAATAPELAATKAAALFWQAQTLFEQKTTQSITQAVAVWREALKFAEQAEDRSRMALTLTRLGDGHNALYEWEQALGFYERALELWRAQASVDGELEVFAQMRPILRRTGQYDRALANNFRARELLRQTGRRRQEVNALNAGGMLYYHLGDHEQARAHYLEALQILRDLNDTSALGAILNNLGNVAQYREQHDDALSYFNEALKWAEANKNPLGIATVLHNQGYVFSAQKRYEAAEPKLLAALRLRREIKNGETESGILNDLGNLYLNTNRRTDAHQVFTEALALSRLSGEQISERTALYGMALLAEKNGDLNAAIQLLEQAIQVFDSVQSQLVSDDLRANFTGSTDGYYGLYLEWLMRRYEQDGSSASAGLAFQAVERARARALRVLLVEAGAQLQTGIDPQLRTRERSLRARIEAHIAERQNLRNRRASTAEQTKAANELSLSLAEYEQLQARIKQSHPHYATLTQPESLTLPDIQSRVLDDDSLLLEYALGRERSFLFAVTKTEIKAFVLPARAEIETSVQRLNEHLTALGKQQVFRSITEREVRRRQTQKASEQAATQLGRMLLPAALKLDGKKRLLIVPDGALHYVPFAALPECGVRSSDCGIQIHGKGKILRTPHSAFHTPLIVHHEIVSLPSASMLDVLRTEWQRRTAAPKTLAVVADPVFNLNDERVSETIRQAQKHPTAPASVENVLIRSKNEIAEAERVLSRLPATQREAEALMSLVPERERWSALGFEANWANVTSAELKQYRFVHFATHGLLNPAYPKLSGLALSQLDAKGQAQPGMLRMLDAYRLELNADLVTLSGCRTALGKEIRGEGLVGLSRGFMYAGARRVLASLWQVNDDATAELMKRFYQGMLGEKKLKPAAALREAQIEMMKNTRWSSPYYWAAFTLQGEW